MTVPCVRAHTHAHIVIWIIKEGNNGFGILQYYLLHRSLQEECGTPFARRAWQDATVLTFLENSRKVPLKPEVTTTALLFEGLCDKRLPLITGYAKLNL